MISGMLGGLVLLLLLALVWLLARRGSAAPAVDDLARARTEASERLAQMIAAQTRLEESEARNRALIHERDTALQQRDAAEKAREAAQRAADLAVQERQGVERRMADWEQAKAASIEAAKAAALGSATELSNKLLADHKREAEASKKDSQEQVKLATDTMLEKFQAVTGNVEVLNRQMAENRQTIDTVHRALSHPGGAGRFAEIGLENTLKSFDLLPDRDFVMQYTAAETDERRVFRPDAVVFLSGDSALVVDSKASKHLLEIAETEGTESEAESYARLADSMNQHLKGLADKAYRAAVMDTYRKSGRAGELRRLISVMYLPNEGAVEKLYRADPEIAQKAARQKITIVGPTGLASLIGFARLDIDLGRQAENQERIIEATRNLLDSLAVTFGYFESVNKGLLSATNNWDKLAKSVNSRLLPRAAALAKFGLRPSGGKALPGRIETFEVRTIAAVEVIEGEAEEMPAGDLLSIADRKRD